MDIWSCFYLLAIMTNAAVNIDIQVSDFLFSDHLDIYLGLKLLHHMVMPYLIFGGTTKFLHILTSACYFPFFSPWILAILLGAKWYLVILVCISLMSSDTEHL